MPGAVWAIVVAGGEGRRFGGAKQFEQLGDRSVLEWSVAAARSVAAQVVVVVPKSHLADRDCHAGADLVVAGGADRAASVRAGLSVVPGEVEVVVVHDAARPLASEVLFAAVVAAVGRGADGAVPGLVVTDTIKRVVGDVVVETLDRSSLVAVQTPQAFRSDVLRRAHATMTSATDDAALLEAVGATVVVVPGEARNLKLTDSSDLALLANYLRDQETARRE